MGASRKCGWKWLSVLCLCIGYSLLLTPSHAATKASEMLVTAETASKAGNKTLAKEIFSQIVSLYPKADEAATASWKLGYMAYNDKDLAQSEKYFQWVADEHPANAKARDALLRVAYLASKQRRPDTQQRFTEVVLRYPDSAEAQLARYRIGRLQTRSLELDTAVENFSAVKDNPNADIKVRAEAAALEGMAFLQKYYKTGDEDELAKGITALESIQEKYPKDTKGVAWSRFRLGMFFIHEGKNVKDERFRNNRLRGREILQASIEDLPPNYFTWWTKAEIVSCYILEKQDKKAVAECLAVLAENPPASWDEYLRYLLATEQIRLGQTKEAIATFQQLVAKYPKGQWASDARTRISMLSEQKGEK